MTQLEADLAAYYDRDAVRRAGRDLDAERVARRTEFLAMLRAEGRRTVLEVGTGPGRDAKAFIDAGLKVTGIDLSAEHVRLAVPVGAAARPPGGTRRSRSLIRRSAAGTSPEIPIAPGPGMGA